MRILVARFSLIIYLFVALAPIQTVEELDKLPQLVAHFQVHKTTDPSTSFYDFWAQHYGSGYAEHQFAHNHKDLPGKNQQQNHIGCVHSIAALPVPPTSIQLPRSVEIAWQPSCFSTTELLTLCSGAGIWQPPKSC